MLIVPHNHDFCFRFLGFLSLLMLTTLLGCSSDDRPRGVPVVGVVTYRGVAVEGADVAFSASDDGTGGFGRTDENGRFQLTARETSGGILPGAYRVKITKFEVESDWTPEHDEGVRPKETSTMGLPAKYAGFESSGLTADVIEGAENEFQFELN